MVIKFLRKVLICFCNLFGIEIYDQYGRPETVFKPVRIKDD